MPLREISVSAFDTLTSHIAVLDSQGAILRVNEAWRRFALDNGSPDLNAYLGANYINVCRLAAAKGDQVASEALDGIAAVMAKTTPRFAFQYRCDTACNPRWFLMTVTPFGSGVLVAHDDVTGFARGEEAAVQLERIVTTERYRFLAEEADHRTKNLLAVVLAISQGSLFKEVSADTARKFTQRLNGLAANWNLLLSNGWERVSLRELIRSQLSPFTVSLDDQVSLRGGELMIQAPAAQALGLAFHELATNAVKYGALSQVGGRIVVAWDIRKSGRAKFFHINWSEEGGPPASLPAKLGFGHKVTVSALEHATGGKVKLGYLRSGLHWELTAPLEELLIEG
jgi:two-component sensor histidine kinase